MKNLFFDLDNTICESRQNTSPEMMKALELLKEKYEVIIVAGLNYDIAHAQCPLENILFMCQNGNEVVSKDGERTLNELPREFKDEIFNHITLLVNERGLVVTDDMIEDRGAQISFSFVGHHADVDTKKKFDLNRSIRTQLLNKFPFPNALIGGTTCIDYVNKTKGQNIENYIKSKNIKPSDCLYIGDALQGSGNDATVCGIIPTYEVDGPEDTLKFINNLI